MSSFSIESGSLFTHGKMHVLWDVVGCPIPEGLEARDVVNNMKKVLNQNGYWAGFSVMPYGDVEEMNEFEGIAISLLPHGNREARVDRYVVDLVTHAIDNGLYTPLTLVLVVGDVSQRHDLFNVVCRLQSRLRFKVLLAQPPSGLEHVSATEDGLSEALSVGQKLISMNCGLRF